MRKNLLAGIFVALILSALLSGAASATNHRFIESFNTKLYCDTLNTTALWDTVAGELRLPPCELEIVGAWDNPGMAGGVEIDGDYAYVADANSGLQIIDITNPESPVIVGTYDTPGTAYDVFADGNIIYVADGPSGVVILDATNPVSPALVGSYNTSGVAYDVVVEGDYAYVADNTSGLVVLNVTNPASPTLAGSYNTPGSARGLAVAGNLAFVADGVYGLQIIGVTNPASPALVGSYDTPGSTQGVVVAGDNAYLADGSYGLQVIDIADPASPALAGGVTLAGTARRIDVDGDLAYVGDFSPGLAEIDISNPSAPVVTRTLSLPSDAWDVEIDGENAFIAANVSGLLVARISCDVPPQMEGVCGFGGSAQRVAIDGDYAYVAAGSAGLQVADISDPAAPVSIGSYATPGDCKYLAISGDYAFASASAAGIVVLDVSDPASPALLGSYVTPEAANGIAVSGDYAFVAAGYTGLIVLSISNPAAPTLLGTCNTPIYAYDVALAGDYAFVADGGGGLQVVDITNPASPTIVGSCAGTARKVVIAGDYAYIVGTAAGVHAIDISNPTSPVDASYYSPSGGEWFYDIAVAGNHLFIAVSETYPSLKVIKIANPETIASLAWRLDLPSSAQGVALAGDYAFMGETASGLRSVRVAQREYLISANDAQSLVLSSSGEQIVRARLSTVQTGSIHWMMKATSGGYWTSVSPDWTWRALTYSGTELLWSSYLYLEDYPNNSVCSELVLEWLYQAAIIDSIRDIPGDQGGQVRVHFARSGYDFGDEATHPISSYYLWRRMDDPAALEAMAREAEPAGANAARAVPAGLPVVDWNGRLVLSADRSSADRAALSQDFPPGTWEIVGSAPGAQKDQYIGVASTLADSTVENGMAYAVYVVTAHTTTPAIWYASAPDSGYSLDNLAPHVPTGFVVAYNSGSGNDLSWDVCPDRDFEYFKVYRGTSEDFVPGAGSLVETTIETGWLDAVEQGYQYFYKISAVDHAGNESAPASAGTVTDADPPATPKTFALYQNVPNPFNPTTRIRFDLPEAADVRLAIYDVSGRKIRELASGQMPAGAREVMWDGRDSAGRAAASGIYFYRLDAGRFTQTRKMILLR